MCQLRPGITKYLDNALAHVQHVQILDPFTGARSEPDETYMREWEEGIDIPEQGADDFRRGLAAYIGYRCMEWDKREKGPEDPRFPPWEFTVPPRVIQMAHAHMYRVLEFPPIDDAWRGWNDRCIERVAGAMLLGPTWQDGPILADALEDAGCNHDGLLHHLRAETPNTDAAWCLAVSICLPQNQASLIEGWAG